MAARISGIVVALVVLGWIGRTAAAGPTSPMSVAATDRDAAAVPLPTLVPIDGGEPITTTAAAAVPPPMSVPAAPAPSTPHGRASAAEPVYLNHASVDELSPHGTAAGAAAMLPMTLEP